jgi:prepilin-type N-terminal cleavage/methylation domain-containing protein/prepilin-type processing-associated H-X9-DG protein
MIVRETRFQRAPAGGVDSLRSHSRRSRSRAFTLVELLVVIAIIGILVALLLPAIQAAREAARRTQCQTNLHNLALGVLNYNDSNKSFPYAVTVPMAARADGSNAPIYGGAALSGPTSGGPHLFQNWVISILPYIEEKALYDSFLLYWEPNPNNPAQPSRAEMQLVFNRVPRGTQLPVMLCPSDAGTSVGPCALSGGNWARGNYAINSGLGFPFSNVDDRYPMNPDQWAWGLQGQRGVSAINLGAKISQIEDGTSQTIMLGELRVGLIPNDRRGVWAMSMVNSSIMAQQGSNGLNGGPNSCVPGDEDLADNTKVITEVGKENLISDCMMPFDADSWGYSAQTVVRSKHPGGAHFALCDGSVRFITNDIQSATAGSGVDVTTGNGALFGVWQRLNSSNDGFVLDQSQF